MKRLIIICEGQTEKEFCIKILAPHFLSKGIIIHYPLIKKSRGGIVSWDALKYDIDIHLKQDKNVYLTLFIDLYGIYDNHNFPAWEISKKILDVKSRVRSIEKAMYDDVKSDRFIPNIVVHEFETILFSDVNTIVSQIEIDDRKITELNLVVEEFEDIELINNSRETAPSKRLEKLIIGYDKIVYGNILAESIGLIKIREKCEKFNEWISNLESI